MQNVKFEIRIFRIVFSANNNRYLSRRYCSSEDLLELSVDDSREWPLREESLEDIMFSVSPEIWGKLRIK